MKVKTKCSIGVKHTIHMLAQNFQEKIKMIGKKKRMNMIHEIRDGIGVNNILFV